jgi:peptidylprolyl isomerase
MALLLAACAGPDSPQPAKDAVPAAPETSPPPTEPAAPLPEPAKPEPPAPAKDEPKPETRTLPKETTLPSGLKTIDQKIGEGPGVKTGDNIIVHYTGWLYENEKRGAQFDSSIGRNPFNFTVGRGVIPGWSEGVVGMQVGGKRQLIIPPNLGYGAQGAGGVIPPNATLDFEVELLKIL